MAVLSILTASGQGQKPERLNIGRMAVDKDVLKADKFVTREGAGLSGGHGNAVEGKEIFERRCAKCHGQKGEGADDAALVGGIGSLGKPKELRTVGSFWPHAPGVWDYVNRAMPFKEPGSMTADQVYAVVAFILNLNGLVEVQDEMNAKTLPKVKMPNRDGFVKDPRPDVKAKR